MKHCKYCGSPSVGNPCWYDISWPEAHRAAWIAGGADAPCVGEPYEKHPHRRAETIRVFVFLFSVSAVLVAIGIGLFW